MTTTTSELLSHVEAFPGKMFTTHAQEKSFQAEVVDDGIIVTVFSSGEQRPIARREIDYVCKEFSQSGSYVRSDYPDTFHGSYILGLIENAQRGDKETGLSKREQVRPSHTRAKHKRRSLSPLTGLPIACGKRSGG